MWVLHMQLNHCVTSVRGGNTHRTHQCNHSLQTGLTVQLPAVCNKSHSSQNQFSSASGIEKHYITVHKQYSSREHRVFVSSVPLILYLTLSTISFHSFLMRLCLLSHIHLGTVQNKASTL